MTRRQGLPGQHQPVLHHHHRLLLLPGARGPAQRGGRTRAAASSLPTNAGAAAVCSTLVAVHPESPATHSTGPSAALHTGHATVHPLRLRYPTSPHATLSKPLSLLPLQGMVFTPAAMAAQGIADPYLVMKHAALAGLCFHAYQQVCAAASNARPFSCGVPGCWCCCCAWPTSWYALDACQPARSAVVPICGARLWCARTRAAARL